MPVLREKTMYKDNKLINIKIMRKIHLYLVVSAFLTGTSAAQSANDNWQVKDATVRYTVQLSVKPSHASAGYFVSIPDGGTLPSPRPEPVVYDAAGKLLKSAVLWHCKDTQCAMIFETPQRDGDVTIYFRGVQKPAFWKPESGLTPSAILTQVTGTREKSAALKLANLGSVSSDVHISNQAWNAGNWKGNSIPLALWERYMDNGSAMYMLAHIEVTDPGRIWIGPLSRSGEMDVAINGKMLKKRKKNDKVGGVGAEIELSKGLHRVELYGYSHNNRVVGPMMFAWRTPKTSIDQLGGERPPDLKYPGTSMGESCSIDAENVLKSGHCTILDVTARSGLVAAFDFKCTELFAFPNEDDLLAYRMKAWKGRNPADAVYTWKIEQNGDALPQGSEISWLFSGEKYTRVTMSVEVGRKSAACSYVFLPYTENSSSIDNQTTRQEFKLACYHMIKAYLPGNDPYAKWNDAMWNNFFRVQELNSANALLEFMITESWDHLKKKLAPERKALVQDIFLCTLSSRKPREALKWCETFGSDEFSTARSASFKLRAADIKMYYLDDPQGADKEIAPLLLSSGEGSELAKIKKGDLEFITGNLNAAIQRYGEVQSQSKTRTQVVLPDRLLPKFAEPVEIAQDRPGRNRRRNMPKTEEQNTFVPLEAPANVENWKLSAIRDVAASENVARLLEQGFYLEAYQALQIWERAFPMAKISGDYLLREADLYMALGDFKRARIILSAYCEQIDLSNFLPEAMNKVKRCMMEMHEPAAEIEKYEQEILKRTVFGGGTE
jgi:hypothetical protein